MLGTVLEQALISRVSAQLRPPRRSGQCLLRGAQGLVPSRGAAALGDPEPSVGSSYHPFSPIRLLAEGVYIMKALRAFIKDEDGVATVEYALLLLLVVMTTLAAWQGFASRLVSGLNQATNAFAELNREPIAP